MNHVSPENYLTIQGWMRTELNLTGNELLVYALIYNFSQIENQQFTGSLQYLADWCGATKQGILKNLKHLIEKGFIEKEEPTFAGDTAKYKATRLNIVKYPIKHSLTNNTLDLSGSIPTSIPNIPAKEHIEKEEGREGKKDRKVDEQEFLGSAKTIAENVRQHDTEKFVETYHEHCPDLPTVRSISDTRRKAILKLLKKYSWDDIIQVFDSAQGSDFLKGKNDRGWKADLDFILREDKFISILEGKYNTKRRTKDGLVLAPRATKEERDGRKYEF